MYFVIAGWGHGEAGRSAMKFFLYTFLGSLLMLVAFIYLYMRSGGSFDVLTWQSLPLPGTAQTFCGRS